MKTYCLASCEVDASDPVLVGQAPGHFWFPSLHALDETHHFCEANLASDRAQGRWPAVLFCSQDVGRSWTRSVEAVTYGPSSMVRLKIKRKT